MKSLVRFMLGRWLNSGTSLESELKGFFGGEIDNLPTITRSHSPVDLPNLERAITMYADKSGTQYRAIGYISEHGFFLNEMRALISSGATVNAPQYREADTGVDSKMRCVENGIHLIETAGDRIAAHVRTNAMTQGLELEVMATSAELASSFLEKIRNTSAESNV